MGRARGRATVRDVGCVKLEGGGGWEWEWEGKPIPPETRCLSIRSITRLLVGVRRGCLRKVPGSVKWGYARRKTLSVL